MKHLPNLAGLLLTCFFVYLGCLHVWHPNNPALSALREGDLVFQSLPHNPLVDAIEGARGSPFSHCGILHATPEGWVVIEAIGPVKETPFSEWKSRARDGEFRAYRLKPDYQMQVPKLKVVIYPWNA